MKKTVIFLLSLISLSVACNQQQQDVPDWNPYDYTIEKKQV